MQPIEILYDSAALVVCIKPAGILSQAGQAGQESMLTLLAEKLQSEIYPVHRLDREVGGVMVYAKTRASAADLSRQIQHGELEKEYLAVIKGRPDAPEGMLEDLLFHDRLRNKVYVVARPRKGVKEARLLYRTIDTKEKLTLVQVRLLTGRTHQIRVQFASRGLPLAGDGRYGGGSGSIGLWSMRLSFKVPGMQKTEFVSLPERMGVFTDLYAPEPIRVSQETSQNSQKSS